MIDQPFIMNQLKEKARGYNLNLNLLFIDFQEAFEFICLNSFMLYLNEEFHQNLLI